MALLLPPPGPLDQLCEVGRLLAVFDDELVLEQLLGRGTLCEERERESRDLHLSFSTHFSEVHTSLKGGRKGE